jgi:predicted lipoprotein with Yx(FWY)xxD motif
MSSDRGGKVRILVRGSVAVLAAALFTVALASFALGGEQATRAPVIKQRDARFGPILATRGHKALYYWNVEKRDYKVHCTGACARAWPPLIVRSRSAVPRRIAGIKGTFGVIRRPDGRLQVTHNRLPIYTYAHEGPNQVLCNNVDGWFVVRV